MLRLLKTHARRSSSAPGPILRLFRFAPVFLCLTTACSPDKIIVCPQLGCSSGLTVHLASLPAAPFRTEITVHGHEGLTYAVDCSVINRCGQEVFFAGLIAERAIVTVKVGDRSRSTDIAPTYSTFEPNGPTCPPLCLSATVNVEVPV